MATSLIHPRLLASFDRFFTARVTIQQATVAQDGFGQEAKTWATLTGHARLPAAIAPAGQTGGEVRTPEIVFARSTHDIVLRGAYPLVKPEMRAVDQAGTVYDVLLVEQDSQGALTRLRCEVIR